MIKLAINISVNRTNSRNGRYLNLLQNPLFLFSVVDGKLRIAQKEERDNCEMAKLSNGPPPTMSRGAKQRGSAAVVPTPKATGSMMI